MKDMATFVGDVIHAVWSKVAKEMPSRDSVHVTQPVPTPPGGKRKDKKRKAGQGQTASAVTKAMWEEENPELAQLCRTVADNDAEVTILLGKGVRKEQLDEVRDCLTPVPELAGADIELAGGVARAPGYLGLDLFAWDANTIPHDLEQGIPIPNGSARSVRLTKALEEFDDPDGLLGEISRVLMPAGKLIYKDDKDLPKTAWLARVGCDPDTGLCTFIRITDPSEDEDDEDDVSDAVAQDQATDDAGYGDSMDAYGASGLVMVDHLVRKAVDDPEQAKSRLRVARAVQKAFEPEAIAPLVGTVPQEQLAYGVILEPEQYDLQDDIIAESEIRDAAHYYLQNSRVILNRHKGDPVQAHVVESYVAPQDLEFSGMHGRQVVRKGSWVVGVKIKDNALWQKVAKGEYTGFSVGGDADRVAL